MNPGDFMIVFSLEAELTTVRAGVSQTSSCRKRHKRRARLRSNGTATNETARARWPSSIRVGTGLIEASRAKPTGRIRFCRQPDDHVHRRACCGPRLGTSRVMCHGRRDGRNGIERSVLTFQKLLTSRRPLLKRPS